MRNIWGERRQKVWLWNTWFLCYWLDSLLLVVLKLECDALSVGSWLSRSLHVIVVVVNGEAEHDWVMRVRPFCHITATLWSLSKLSNICNSRRSCHRPQSTLQLYYIAFNVDIISLLSGLRDEIADNLDRRRVCLKKSEKLTHAASWDHADFHC